MNLPGLFPGISAILAVVFVCALVSGCSDDGDGPGDSGTADTGGSIDKGPILDGDPTPDSAPPVCDNTCRQQDVQLCVKDGTGTCVQCLEDKHCKKKKAGKYCISGKCQKSLLPVGASCERSQDCKSGMCIVGTCDDSLHDKNEKCRVNDDCKPPDSCKSSICS